MFKKIYFYNDTEGKRRSEPLILDIKDVRGKHFYLVSEETNTRDGRYPCVRVMRSYKKLETDPYNEDGRPPTVWTTILIPHITFFGTAVELVGLEDPNMCFAGLVRPAYEMCPPLTLPADRIWARRDFDRNDLPKQRILLVH